MHSVFRNTTFRRLFAGRLITNAGDSLYYVAAMLLVYELGGSAFYTGLAGFLTLAPVTLQFLAGPLVDRWDLRRLLVGTQILQGMLVLSIPLAAWMGWLSVGVVLVVMPIVSLLNQLVYPAQSAALPRIVDEEELVDANSAFSLAYQGVDTAFSSLGGILVALLGAVSLYLVDSVTFVITAIIFAVTWIPAAEGTENDSGPEQVTSALSDYAEKLREGIEYIRGTIFTLILAVFVVVNFAFGATMAALPVFAALHGGADSYGFLLAAITAGLLLGALGASPLKRVSLGRFVMVGFAFSGTVWLAAVAADWLPLTVALFALAWIPVGVSNVIFMAMFQTLTPKRLVGRVTSVITSAAAAAMPFGSLLGGVAASAWGPSVVVAATGVGFLFVTLYWLSFPSLRRLPAIEEIDPEKYGLRSSSGRVATDVPTADAAD